MVKHFSSSPLSPHCEVPRIQSIENCSQRVGLHPQIEGLFSRAQIVLSIVGTTYFYLISAGSHACDGRRDERLWVMVQ